MYDTPAGLMPRFTEAQLRNYAKAALQKQSAVSGGSDCEELRLTIAHLRGALQETVIFARNSIRTNSCDVENWRDDMQTIIDRVEGRLKT